MTPAPGFAVDLVAAEPLVRQPVAIEFDDRGRLWVMQYLQYPNPAGLKRVKVDRYSRTVYDRVPEPPPRGTEGGRPHHDPRQTPTATAAPIDREDFVTGLNLASGLAFGHGGVFVLQAPYLLFYPDRNRDDVPDGDPEVLLTGFGMEDAHSVANSLTWGPTAGSTAARGAPSPRNIRGIEFQQGVWRYHPRTHEFELFCEGGGNSWGLDFDRHGNLLYSTNVRRLRHAARRPGRLLTGSSSASTARCTTRTRSAIFDHVPHHELQRRPRHRRRHRLPGRLRSRRDSAASTSPATCSATRSTGTTSSRTGSTFRTAHGGDLLLANDTWFAPSDVTLGPDGASTSPTGTTNAPPIPTPTPIGTSERPHLSPPPERSGLLAFDRLVAGNGCRPASPLSGRTDQRLAAWRGWPRRLVLRMLAERRDVKIATTLRTRLLGPTTGAQASERDPIVALRCCGAYVSGGFDESLALTLLDHPYEAIRAWTVRYLGDERM